MKRTSGGLGLWVVLVSVAAGAFAQAPFLVKDLNTSGFEKDSNPQEFLAVGDVVYFQAGDDQHGFELWRSDGTRAGTSLVADLCPGTCDGIPAAMVALGQTLVFVAWDGGYGAPATIWRSDGTRRGTVRLSSAPALGGQWPLGFLPLVDGRIVYPAWDGDHGWELWRSDGTVRGTSLLADLCPGPCSSKPGSPALAGGALYFEADDGVHGRELWRSDATRSGTRLVGDLCAGACDAQPSGSHMNSSTVGASLVFEGSDGSPGLWATDGAGYRRLGRISGVKFLGEIPRGRLLTSGGVLYRTDGTTKGTIALTDLPPSSVAFEWVTTGGSLYLRVIDFLDADHGVVLETDGTVAGTAPVPELQPGGAAVAPRSLRVFDGRILFTLDQPGSDQDFRELWAYDPATGTSSLLNSELGGEPILWGPAIDGRLFFRDGDLWSTDGTVAGTVRLGDVQILGPAEGYYAVTARGELLFPGDDGIHGYELWRATSAPGSPSLVRDLRPATASGDPRLLIAFGGRLYFVADDGGRGILPDWKLFRSDGSAAGTEVVLDGEAFDAAVARGRLYLAGQQDLWVVGDAGPERILEGNDWEVNPPDEITAAKNGVVFRTSRPGQRLWRTDGTAQGTVLVRDLNPAWDFDGCGSEVCPRLPAELTRAGGFVYFVAQEDRRPQLWRTDGSDAGTRALLSSPAKRFPEQLTALGSTLVFTAFRKAEGRELWSSRGGPGDTGLIADLTPGRASSDLRHFTAAGNRIYFVRRPASERDELWRTDGTAAGTRKVADLGGRADEVAALGARLVLSVDQDATGRELWTSDGTSAGTRLLLDLWPGRGSSAPQGFRALGGRLYFAADDGEYGLEPWTSDGTAAGTRRLADVASGPTASSPSGFTRVGDTLYFAADDGVHGRELFGLPLD